jgi:PAS domain S-box-containing protein
MSAMNRVQSVMIVEDEELIAADLEYRLQELGYKVSAVVSNSKAALEALLGHKPEVVLMDINIEGDCDGIDTAVLVKDRFDIPVVFLTAQRDRKTFDRANNAEPFGYLEKPAGDRDLVNSIEIACRQHQSKGHHRLREAWLEAQLESIGVGLVVADHLGIIKFANAAAEEILGLSQNFLVGKCFQEGVLLKNKVTGTRATGLFQQAVLHGSTMDLGSDFCLRSPTGENRDIAGEIALSRFCGEIIGMLFTFRDVSVPMVARDSIESKIVWQTPQLFIPTSFDLNKVVAQTCLQISEDFPSSITIDLALAPNASKVYGNCELFKRILEELVANSRRCLPFGGSIQMRTEDVAFERRLPDGSTSRYVRLNVSCSGPRVAPDNAFLCHDAGFDQAKSNMRLAALSSAIRAFKGSIRTVFRDGEFLFDVVLPTDQVTEPQDNRKKPSAILLLEPEAQVRISLSDYLESEHHEVLGAVDAEELLEWSRAYDDDIAVLVLSEEAYRHDAPIVHTLLRERPFTSVLLVLNGRQGSRRMPKPIGWKFLTIEKLFSTSMLSVTLQRLLEHQLDEIAYTGAALS